MDIFLPPANEIWGMVMIFTPVCHSVHGGRDLPDRDNLQDRDSLLDMDPPWTETPWTETPMYGKERAVPSVDIGVILHSLQRKDRYQP